MTDVLQSMFSTNWQFAGNDVLNYIQQVYIYLHTNTFIYKKLKEREILGWNMRKPSANRPRIAF